jgi:glyoxylase-like metal-dependent hydrolase (beta-lactamase superfamily II)
MTEAAVHRIVIPTPLFEGDVNLYAIADEPLTLIDTGIGTPDALRALELGLLEHGLRLEDVRQVVLTHKHADHIGLAREIRERSGATVSIHEDDWDNVVHLDARHEEFIPLVCKHLKAYGTPQPEIDALTGPMKRFNRLARPVEAERLADGQRLPLGRNGLEVVHTPGHTQGSICLRYGRHLFTGDHVLPTISPNIGAGELRRSGMLRRYLDSLDRIARLQADDLVALPGHGAPFTDLAGRVAELKAHHAEREEAILAIVRGGGALTVYEVALQLFGPLPSYHLMLGTAEAQSHLEKLATEGRLTLQDGRYRAA